MKCRVPNLVILLDVLFIFLFMFLLKPEDGVFTHRFIDKQLPKEAIVVTSYKNGMYKYYYDFKSKKWDKLIFNPTYINIINNPKDEFVVFENIDSNIKKIITLNDNLEGQRIDVLFYGNIRKQIAEHIFQKCYLEQVCKDNKLRFLISKNGSVDLKLIK